MTIPSTLYGTCGRVNIGSSGGVSEITKWSFTPKSDAKSYVSGQSEGCERTNGGPRSATGTVESKLDLNDKIIDLLKVGEKVDLELVVKPGLSYQVTAVITDGPTLTVDPSDYITAAFSFKADGFWTYPDGTTSKVECEEEE